MKDTVERHFSKVINEIEAGLPSVSFEDIKDDDEDSDIFIKAKTWTCINCTMVNQMHLEKCGICRLARPDIAKKNYIEENGQ